MDTILIILCVCLLLLCAWLIIWRIWFKRQLRRFAAEVKKRENADYEQPVKLDSFDKDIVALAVAINRHVDIQRALAVSYNADKKRLSEIVSGISHDFRTPLTAALGYLQMIEKSGVFADSESSQNAEYLEIAIQKNEYLKLLSDDFFEISKLESGNQPPETESVNISNLLSEIVLQQYGWIEENSITTSFEIGEGIIVESNAHALGRIFDNLFSNAQKYAKTRLAVVLKKDNDSVILTVANDIEDMSELDVERVFQLFYRGCSRSKSGSGLGLYVVKCLCDSLGVTTEASIENGLFCVKINVS